MSEFFEEVRGISKAFKANYAEFFKANAEFFKGNYPEIFKANYAENKIRRAAINGESMVNIVPYGETSTELIERMKAYGFTTVFHFTPPHGRSMPSKRYVTVSW